MSGEPAKGFAFANFERWRGPVSVLALGRVGERLRGRGWVRNSPCQLEYGTVFWNSDPNDTDGNISKGPCRAFRRLWPESCRVPRRVGFKARFVSVRVGDAAAIPRARVL